MRRVRAVPCVGQHGPTEARHALGPCWALLQPIWPSKARSDPISCYPGPTNLGPKYDVLVSGRHDPPQVTALGMDERGLECVS